MLIHPSHSQGRVTSYRLNSLNALLTASESTVAKSRSILLYPDYCVVAPQSILVALHSHCVTNILLWIIKVRQNL